MAKRKVRNRKKVNRKKSANFEINNITRVVLVVVAILLFLCFFTTSMGKVGLFLNNGFYLLFGDGKILIPILLILLAINSYLNSIETNDIILIITALVILVLISLFLDSISSKPGIYKNRFIYGLDSRLMGINGGIVGGFLNSFLLSAFGELGLLIIIIILMVISIFVFFNLDYENIGNQISRTFSNLNEKRKIRAEERKAEALKEEKRQALAEQIEDQNETDLEINGNGLIDSSKAFEEEKDDRILNINIGKDEAEKGKDPYLIDNEIPTDDIEKISKVTERDKTEIQKEIDKKDVESEYEFPPLSLLNKRRKNNKIDKSEIIENSRIIEETMANFGIEASVERVNTGPTVTCYELVPAQNVRLNKIVSLADNLSFSLASTDIRIEAPIPGKTAVGIEVPNKNKSMVTLEEVINSKEFEECESEIPLVLGKDTDGDIVISAIEEMPHLLIAGATGSGKSVCINSIIISLLYKTTPEDLRMILVDPKIVELSGYNSIPHLLIPVVTDPKKAASTLAWAVEEMERRYKTFAENYVKDINNYNEKMAKEGKKMEKIVIIIDELADLMAVASNEVEDYIARLAQMARAAGMHLILATQRPSVDVITGTIKANIPSRISFAVSSQVDSRTILDSAGAEKLLGKGDMLFYPSFYSKPRRLQGTFVSPSEIDRVVDFFKDKDYDVDVSEEIIEEIKTVKNTRKLDSDPLIMDAIKIIVYEEQASISYLQRKLSIGYSRAARIVDTLEEHGFVGPNKGSKPRDVYITEEEYLKLLGEDFD